MYSVNVNLSVDQGQQRMNLIRAEQQRSFLTFLLVSHSQFLLKYFVS